MSKQTEINLFIVSSLPRFYQRLLAGVVSYKELGNRIIREIKAAHAFRQVEAVRELAGMLINLPAKEYQLIAQYYLAWCECRELKYNHQTLERVIEQSSHYKTKALISRGALSFYQGRLDEAMFFYTESLKTKPNASDYLLSVKEIAVIKSIEGFRESALKDMEALMPLLRYAEPFALFDVLNSYAVELGEAGRKDEARNIIKHVLESPFLIAYPEWRETAEDLREANRSFAVIDPSPHRPRNVLSMPTLERDGAEFPAWAGQLAPVVSYQKGKRRMGKKKKGNNKPNPDEMSLSDMMFRITSLYCDDQTTDEQRFKMWEAVEKIAANEPDNPYMPESPDDDKPGA